MIGGGCQLAIFLISWHLTSLSLLSPSGCHYESGSGGQGPGGSREGGLVDGPHIALLLPPCVVLAASSIVSHQKLIVVWQTPFISLCTVPAPGVECRRTRGSGIIAVVVASCTCYNVRHGAISQCTTLGLIRSLPLGRWGCLGGVRWAQQGIEDANVGGKWSSWAQGFIVWVWAKYKRQHLRHGLVMSVLDRDECLWELVYINKNIITGWIYSKCRHL